MSYTNFIPSWHFVAPELKLKNEWCYDAVKWSYFQHKNNNLLHGKELDEIEGYATGDFDMAPFRKMYKSIAKKMDANIANSNDRNVNQNEIGFVPLPLIPTKLNSAIAVVQKIPIEISVSAIDPLAVKKKNEDLTFLKNKPAIEADLQEVADQMQIGKVDLGSTKHSAIPFSDSPYGLDLNEPDELQVFVDLLYNLSVEAAFETSLEQFQSIKNGLQIKLLEISDHFKYGVSVNMAFESTMTGLPDVKYIFPGALEVPYSKLPDYSDNTHRFMAERMSVLDMFNAFGDEICNEETLNEIINSKDFGYCVCNNLNFQSEKNFNSFKVDLIYCEIKSIDYVGIAPINKKSKFSYIVTDPEELKTCTNKIWAQNTYSFYWLKNTKHFFGIKKLPFSNRTIGNESYQNFSTNIYRSQLKSAVELSIGENKKAQIADIKMQHAILKSLPSGKYINLKFLRSALGGLKEGAELFTIEQLITLALEQNQIIGDTEGFDGKNDGQLKAFEDIVGGLKIAEIAGYIQVIMGAKQNISEFTGINEQLTGQSANPEGLIGLQKLLINSSINSIYYVNEAISNQEQKKFNIWATIIKSAIEKGGKTKQAIVDLVGAKKVSLIDALDEVPLHKMGVKITVSQREEEKQEFRTELNRLKINGVINTVDEYMLSGISNPKDRMALLAVKYKQWQKRQEKQRQEDAANQQAMIQAQGQNMQAAIQAKGALETQKIYAQGDVSSKILQLSAQLGMQGSQMDFLGKKSLQQDRGTDQTNKAVTTLKTKAELDNQKAYGT